MKILVNKLAGRPMTASCLLAASERGLRGTGVSGSRGARVLGSAFGSAVVARPTGALVAAQVKAEQAYAGVIAGAGLQEQTWVFDGFGAVIPTDAGNEQHRKMRANRGPEPWQEPS
ncbi:hypothetical protein ACFQLX_16800 [Streptomyces polyrhachis]|uniref:Uncharacterized protein n=1 Tax=Streptomyces polyrhachis TaxID=1282885 RepID=A0ABW2GLP3_9ACTN